MIKMPTAKNCYFIFVAFISWLLLMVTDPLSLRFYDKISSNDAATFGSAKLPQLLHEAFIYLLALICVYFISLSVDYAEFVILRCWKLAILKSLNLQPYEEDDAQVQETLSELLNKQALVQYQVQELINATTALESEIDTLKNNQELLLSRRKSGTAGQNAHNFEANGNKQTWTDWSMVNLNYLKQLGMELFTTRNTLEAIAAKKLEDEELPEIWHKYFMASNQTMPLGVHRK